MPPLSVDEFAALRADVAARGIVVAVVVDQHGRILDGHHRRRVADELGIECPTEVRTVRTDDEALDVAVALNAARRHLSREQRRELIRAEIARRPDDSDRAVARRVGCSPTTVGTVRAEAAGVSKLDTSTSEAEAREVTEQLKASLRSAREHLMVLGIEALSNKISVAEIVTAFTVAIRSMERDGLDEHHVIRDSVYDPILDWLLDPATAEEWRREWDHETFKPLTADEKSGLLAALAGESPDRNIDATDERVTGAEAAAIRLRWEFGRELLDGPAGDPPLAAVVKATGKSRTELTYRMRLAERYPTEEALNAGIEEFGSWDAFVRGDLKREWTR
ncbi:MAG TPA: ParB N-terminal domain-containing protein [Actinomycetales bacterium]|nr:ParB N-terminal domain-containing protein [Actinomycetales bacterium]